LEWPAAAARRADLAERGAAAEPSRLTRAGLEPLLGGDDCAWLIDRLAERLLRNKPLVGTMTLLQPTTAQREAVERLLGRSPSNAKSLSVPLAVLEHILVSSGVCASLEDATRALRAEALRDKQSRIEREQRWCAFVERLRQTCENEPVLSRWLTHVHGSGLLARLSGKMPDVADALAQRIVALRARLPTAISLAELAVQLTGDAHALDAGTPLGTLALHLLASLIGTPVAEHAAGRREAWQRVGVSCDDLSASVLILNLDAHGDSLTARMMRMYKEAGEPCRLTLRQLLADLPQLTPADRKLYVCENPSIVNVVADRQGMRSPPLVCTSGQPNGAVHALLARLSKAGAELRYHGDFDWPGIEIANLIVTRHGARPWHMDAAAYESAPKGVPLDGAPVTAVWDPRLSAAMREVGRAVHEEAVLFELLNDLAAE
jgi:uncharacterized protein (TIGR02679 family)